MQAMSQDKKDTVRKTKGGPSEVDVHVGGRMRQRRNYLNMSQERLADALGLTFQQVQKYERGTNRIGASRLFDLSRILDVPISFFFEGLSRSGLEGKAAGFAEQGQEPYEDDPMTRKETIELVRAYYKIMDPKLRRRFLNLVKSMADSAASEDGVPESD